MPDSNIGSLPQVPNLDDGSLMVVEQQGQAMKMTGAQFKDFGRQSVIAEVQGYVDEAQQAAERATGAVQAVAGMTVSAHNLEHGQEATVSKTIVNDVFHLSFGLPEGKQGIPGPEGKEGPRGPRGDTGRGLDILGYYDTIEELEAAQTSPEAGEAYGVGTEAPYDIYVFDGVTNTWKNNGPLSGGGSIVPENVVTSEGGAAIVVDEALGYAPHVITITDEEELPLTAGDIEYKEGTVETALEGLFTSVSDGKALVASAITDKGVETPSDATFSQMAGNIRAITTGSSTEDATATPGDILAPKTAYVAGGKVEGIIPTLYGKTITPGTADQTIAGGQYLGGTQVIKGDTNLVSANIRKGITLFGVDGAMEQTFLATLTVTVDIGAVVTATNGDVEISALCTTGAVTLELPIEGQWTVTARRGVAQYNSVIVTVSSSYSATLTAELHIVYFGEITPLSQTRGYLAAVTVGNYAIFAGGEWYRYTPPYADDTDIYDNNLSYIKSENMPNSTGHLAGTTVGDTALIAGGLDQWGSSNKIITYTKDLVRGVYTHHLSDARFDLGATGIGEYALFAGGNTEKDSKKYSSVVDAFDSTLTQTTPTPLALAEPCVGAANGNYAIFCGKSNNAKVSAYDENLTRTIAAAPSQGQFAAARAGNYVVFAGEDAMLTDAYDLFLTRTMPQSTPLTRHRMAGTTLHDYALFVESATDEGGTFMATDIFDAFLTRTEIRDPFGEFNGTHIGMAAISIGDFALFAGDNVQYDQVRVYQYQ